MYIVLIEVWERARGYNTWMPTKAIVQSSTVSGIKFGKDAAKQTAAWQSVCKIVWQDQHGTSHAATFDVFEESPLYQLCDGDTVDIRFNPKRPDAFYLPGLIQSRLSRTWKLTLWGALLLLVLIGFAITWFGPNILTALSH